MPPRDSVAIRLSQSGNLDVLGMVKDKYDLKLLSVPSVRKIWEVQKSGNVSWKDQLRIIQSRICHYQAADKESRMKKISALTLLLKRFNQFFFNPLYPTPPLSGVPEDFYRRNYPVWGPKFAPDSNGEWVIQEIGNPLDNFTGYHTAGEDGRQPFLDLMSQLYEHIDENMLNEFLLKIVMKAGPNKICNYLNVELRNR